VPAKRIYLFSEKYKHKARILLQQAVKKKQIVRHCTCGICKHDITMLQEEKENLKDRFLHSKQKKRYPLSAHHFHYQKPYDVWWLCDFCHYSLHRAQLHFQIACLTLPEAKKITQNFISWGTINGYDEFVKKEKCNIKQELELLRLKKKELLMQYAALSYRYSLAN